METNNTTNSFRMIARIIAVYDVMCSSMMAMAAFCMIMIGINYFHENCKDKIVLPWGKVISPEDFRFYFPIIAFVCCLLILAHLESGLKLLTASQDGKEPSKALKGARYWLDVNYFCTCFEVGVIIVLFALSIIPLYPEFVIGCLMSSFGSFLEIFFVHLFLMEIKQKMSIGIERLPSHQSHVNISTNVAYSRMMNDFDFPTPPPPYSSV